MRKLILLFAAVALTAAAAHAQAILQDFSQTVGSLTFFYGTWEANGDNGGTNNPNPQFLQGAGVFDVTGDSLSGHTMPTNDANSKMEFFNASPVSIGTDTALSVTAQSLATNTAPAFTISLIDTSGHTAFATFNAGQFITGSYTTATGSLTFQSGFNATQIDSMIISGGQLSGTDRFNISFDTVSATAVPEPAFYATLAGIGALGLALWARRGGRLSAATSRHRRA
ncbi:MAG TPA: hypothetical protein VHD62_12570 [Opitutaceae bacterium]|nr:hypothetical protein [Opitutaceae bacterium]